MAKLSDIAKKKVVKSIWAYSKPLKASKLRAKIDVIRGDEACGTTGGKLKLVVDNVCRSHGKHSQR